MATHRFRTMRFLVALAVAVSGCSESDTRDLRSPIEPNPSSGLDLTFSEAFSGSILQIRAGNSDEISTLRVWQDTPDGFRKSAIERRHGDGSLISTIGNTDDQSYFHSFVSHSNGQISAIEAISEGGRSLSFTARLVRFDQQGNLSHTDSFDLAQVDGEEARSCVNEDKERGYFWSRSLSLAAIGDSLYVVRYNCAQYWISKFDSQLKHISSTILPAPPDIFYYYGQTVMAADEEREIIHVAYGFGDKKNLITLDSDLNTRYSKKVSSGESIALGKDRIYLGSTNSFGAPGRDRDVVLQGFDAEDGELLWEKRIDIDREEGLSAIAVLDEIVFIGGDCGWEQASTGSITRHGNAFVAAVNANSGELRSPPQIFGADRHDKVTSIAVRPTGQVVVAGMLNGPITHDGDHDRQNRYSHAFLRHLDARKILGHEP